MTATMDIKRTAQYIGLAVCTLSAQMLLWVAHILWSIIKEIVNGVFRMVVNVVVFIITILAFIGLFLWLLTL